MRQRSRGFSRSRKNVDYLIFSYLSSRCWLGGCTHTLECPSFGCTCSRIISPIAETFTSECPTCHRRAAGAARHELLGLVNLLRHHTPPTPTLHSSLPQWPRTLHSLSLLCTLPPKPSLFTRVVVVVADMESCASCAWSLLSRPLRLKHSGGDDSLSADFTTATTTRHTAHCCWGPINAERREDRHSCCCRPRAGDGRCTVEMAPSHPLLLLLPPPLSLAKGLWRGSPDEALRRD
jgi:hypothetical protein